MNKRQQEGAEMTNKKRKIVLAEDLEIPEGVTMTLKGNLIVRGSLMAMGDVTVHGLLMSVNQKIIIRKRTLHILSLEEKSGKLPKNVKS